MSDLLASILGFFLGVAGSSFFYLRYIRDTLTAMRDQLKDQSDHIATLEAHILHLESEDGA